MTSHSLSFSRKLLNCSSLLPSRQSLTPARRWTRPGFQFGEMSVPNGEADLLSHFHAPSRQRSIEREITRWAGAKFFRGQFHQTWLARSNLQPEVGSCSRPPSSSSIFPSLPLSSSKGAPTSQLRPPLACHPSHPRLRCSIAYPVPLNVLSVWLWLITPLSSPLLSSLPPPRWCSSSASALMWG
jgi:hypothetical protein